MVNEQTPPKRKRRVRGFRDLLQPQGLEEGPGTAVDVSMLYPQMNPYTNSNRQSSHSTHSAPEELERYHNRTVSQNSAPGYLDPSSHSDFAPPMNAPRSPTYPPAGRRRMHSATGLGDAAFADEAEYRLFVEATAGLGPEQSFRPFDPVSQFPVSPLSPSPRRTQSERISTIGPASPRDIVSPLSETPTTRFALQHLAQMPHGSTHPSLEPLQTTHSAVDMWLQPPSAEPLDFIDEQFAALDLDLDDDHLNDELPGYAESQAQAQQHQRAEAARRAQELQMRWQMSGGRRGV
ncbi:hypothetical protein LTR09_003405 [Extremus antarcticus]|uniref:Uncharacterized protein n=1 Tax=Extremus antarcticus TaxID=702011 RepID=A0AAJ0DSF6_9PEZI|nr:hypothetical protein LTR09_003405 [Extremus antarcticus]